jgi:CDP-glucose 4,6-dehydratase
MKLPNIDFWKEKRVYITGAKGFKGRWMTLWLSRMGAIVSSNGDVDICSESRIREQLELFQPEIVIHMAAVSTVKEALDDPMEAIRTNALGTISLLEILRDIPGIKAILNVTTDKVYHIEGVDRGYIESDALGGLETYAISKVCSEHISTVYQKTYGLPLATARAGNVLGGGDWKRSRIIPNFYYAYNEDTILDVNINAVRPWQYVLDALCGYLLLCEKLYDNNAYVGAWNFASNEFESRTVQWIVDEMNRWFSPKLEYHCIDDRGFYETKNLKLCSDKARKALNWEPMYDMKETVRRTAAWYLRYMQGEDEEVLYLYEIDKYMEGVK